MIAVDTSALVVILRDEPEKDRFLRTIAYARRCMMSAPTFLECCMVLSGRQSGEREAFDRIDDTLRQSGVTIVAFDEEQAIAARDAFGTYGKGRRSRAALNFGDCISYALAKTQGVPLLFKGNDFSETDIQPAIR